MPNGTAWWPIALAGTGLAGLTWLALKPALKTLTANDKTKLLQSVSEQTIRAIDVVSPDLQQKSMDALTSAKVEDLDSLIEEIRADTEAKSKIAFELLKEKTRRDLRNRAEKALDPISGERNVQKIQQLIRLIQFELRGELLDEIERLKDLQAMLQGMMIPAPVSSQDFRRRAIAQRAPRRR